MASASTFTSIEERERILAERAKALDERNRVMDEKEKDMARRENSFELQNLEQEWDSLVEAESKLRRMERLTSFELDEREAKLERKTQKLEQLEALIQVRQNDIDRGIFYR
jgi:hypothetical protein